MLRTCVICVMSAMPLVYIWAATWGNVPSDMCVQRILRSACACAQSDQSICCPYENFLHLLLSKMRPVKTLIRLCECRYGWFTNFTYYGSTIFIAPACSRVRYRRPIFRPSVRPSVSPSVRPSVRLSTFMSTFDIYVKVSILINYKTKQPSNLAWNISLTSWLCDIGVRFSVCLSIRPSVCQHLCRSSTFMSKLVF